jgi:putative ABC transport system permease protein
MDRATWSRNIRIGAEALGAHRLRSALATLGVLFGVAAVVCMMAIGKGAERRVLAEYQRLGIHNLHIEARAPDAAATRSLLSADDGRALVAELAPVVGDAAAERGADRKVWALARNADARVVGVTPEYARLLDVTLVGGRFVGDLDVARGAAICVLSEPLAAALFPARSALGEIVHVGGQALRVVGLVRATALGAGTRPVLYVPLPVAARIPPGSRDPRGAERVIVRITPGTDPAALAPVVERALVRRHGSHDFSIVVPSELVRKAQRTQRIFQFVMGGIAAISLLVGGIGIANILFASVVERTFEIGLRRATGARRTDITAQFLFEAAAIATAGGLAGLALGIGGAFVVARAAHWPVVVTPAALGLSLGTALATGLLSGWIPARHAATVDAIVALRHE